MQNTTTTTVSMSSDAMSDLGFWFTIGCFQALGAVILTVWFLKWITRTASALWRKNQMTRIRKQFQRAARSL